MTFPQRILAALLAAVVTLCGTAVLADRSMNRLVDARASVDQTERILRQMEETYSVVSDAEAGSRGYVLTGDTAFLAPYRAAIESLPARMDALHALSAASLSRHAHLARLQDLMSRRLDAIRATVDLRRTSGEPAAVAHIRLGPGRALMDSIRLVVDEMASEEEALRRADVARARVGVRRVTTAITIGLLLALVIALLAAGAVRRELDARALAERALRQGKAAAEEANRAKSDFLARMSHELRTPLNSVIGFSNVLLKRHTGGGDPRAGTYLERIRDNGMHLLLMIDDLLDISRIEVGRVKIERETVSLEVLVHDAVESFEEEARRRGLALDVEMPAGLPPIDTDAGRLRQILMNLVGNALKFTERGGVAVRVTADPATGAPLSIVVTDTGIGIAPDRQQAVFEAFEQADTGTSRRYGGTGLGLAISRALCDALGYRLELTSEVGAGSTFRVVLAS